MVGGELQKTNKSISLTDLMLFNLLSAGKWLVWTSFGQEAPKYSRYPSQGPGL